MKQNRSIVTVIRRSCLTGNPVWIYQGPAQTVNLAYCRACKREIERVKQWSDFVERRCSNIAKFLSDCMANIPITAKLTAQQEAAVRQLRAIEKRKMPCHSEFYDHIIEEQRRRRFTLKIHAQMRERQLNAKLQREQQL